MTFLRWLTIVLLVGLFSSCGGVQTRIQMETTGEVWIVTDAEGHDPDRYNFVPNVEELRFGTNIDPQISVFDGCNEWNADIDWSDTGFVHRPDSEGITTNMDCFKPSSFGLKALIADSAEVEVTVVDGTLVMDNGTVTVTAVLQQALHGG